MTPRPRPMWRKVLRWALIGLGVLVVLVGAALLVLETGWGKNKVRRELVSRLQEHVRGTVSIGELGGSLLGDVTLRNVDIEGQGGLTHVHIDALSLDFRLLPLASRHFHADAIDLQGLTVKALRGKDGRLGLADLWVSGPPSGPPWSVTIEKLSLERGAARVEVSPGRIESADQVELAAALEMGADSTAVELDHLTGHWAGPDLQVAAHGHLDLAKDGGLDAWDAALELGRSTQGKTAQGKTAQGKTAQGKTAQGKSTLSLLRLRRSADGALTTVALAAHLRVADLRAISPDARLRADTDLVAMGGQAAADKPIELALFGAAGSAALAGHVAVIPPGGTAAPRGQAQLFWAGVRPEALWTGAPRADVHGSLVASGGGAGLATARADLQLRVGGTLGSVRVGLAGLEAHLADRHARVHLAAEGPLARVTADARITVPARLRDPRDLEIDTATLDARTGDVGRVLTATGAAAPPAVRGPLTVTARAHGRAGDLSATAHVESASLHHQDLEATGVDAVLRADHLPARTSGRVEVQVGQLRQGATRYGDARLQATLTGGRSARVRFHAGGRAGLSAGGDVSLEVSPAGAASVAIHQLDLTTRGLTWRAGGGHVEVAPGARHIAGSLGLRSAAGRVSVTADLDRTGAPGVAGVRGPVRVQVVQLDLGRMMKTAGVARDLGLRGTVTARGRMSLPNGPGRFDVHAGSVTWAGGPPSVTGHVAATLEHRRLALRADARSGRLGRVHAEALLRAPARVTEPAAWRRLGRRAVRSVVARADDVGLAAWSKQLGIAWGRAGTACVTVDLGPALDKGQVTLEIKGGRVAATSSRVVPVEGQLALALDKRALVLTGQVDAGKAGRLVVDAGAGLPPRPLDPASWRHNALALVRAGRVQLIGLHLEELSQLLPGGTVAMAGTVGVDMVVQEKVRGATVRVTATGVHGGAVKLPLSGQVNVDMDGGHTRVTLQASARGQTLVSGSAKLAAGTGLLTRDATDRTALGRALRRSRIEGSLTVPQQKLSRLVGASGTGNSLHLSGELGGKVTLRGSLARPLVSGRLSAPGLTIEKVRFDALDVTGSYRAGPWQVTATVRQSHGGTLTARARGDAGTHAPLSMHLGARNLELAFLSPLWRKPAGTLTYLDGLLSANLDVGGSRARPVVDGWVKLRKGEIRLANLFRPLENATLDLQAKKTRTTISFKATSRPGKLEVFATVDASRPEVASFTARINGHNLPVMAGKQLVSVNGRVDVTGRVKDRIWHMGARIRRGLIVRLPESNVGKLHPVGGLDDVEFVDAAGIAARKGRQKARNSVLHAIRLKVTTEESILVRGEQVNARLVATLDVTWIQGQTSIQGTVKAPGGYVQISANRWEIQRGVVSFGGEMPVNPYLDVRIARDVQGEMVYVDVVGRLSAPQVTFASDSGAYDQAQLLGMVLSGQAPGAPPTGGTTLSEKTTSTATAFLTGQLTSAVRQTGLPVDALRVGTSNIGGQEEVSYVTVGKWVTPRLFVAYRHRFVAEPDENFNEGTFQDYFARDWMIEGVAGDRGTASLDILWIVPF